MLEGALCSNESWDISCNVSRHDDSQHNCLQLPLHPLIFGRVGIPVQPPDEGISPKPVVVGPSRGIQFENHPIDTLSPSPHNEMSDPIHNVHRDLMGSSCHQPDTRTQLRGDSKGKHPIGKPLPAATKGAVAVPPILLSNRQIEIYMNPHIRNNINSTINKLHDISHQLKCCSPLCDAVLINFRDHNWSGYLQPLGRLGVDTSTVNLKPVTDHLVKFTNQHYKNKKKSHQRHSNTNWNNTSQCNHVTLYRQFHRACNSWTIQVLIDQFHKLHRTQIPTSKNSNSWARIHNTVHIHVLWHDDGTTLALQWHHCSGIFLKQPQHEWQEEKK